MFKREHHMRIATVLQAMDSEVLDQYHCLFGGGTAIVLARNEYRESIDIDFLISDREGYQKLRQLFKQDGIKSITREGLKIETARDVRVDQYGIRTMLLVGDVEIKFEIVFESRISLEPDLKNQNICGISVLSDLDMAATKLLANSDRWADDSVYSRDIIDLAMVGLTRESLKKAIKKSEQAYGDSIHKDLEKAISSLSQRKGRLEECMDALKIDIPKALLWKNIRELKA